jgi:hypothetical protein
MGLELIVVMVFLITLIQIRMRAPYRVFLKNETYKKANGLSYPCVVVYCGRRLHANPLIVKRLFADDIANDDEKLLDSIQDAKTSAIRLNSAGGHRKPRQLMR